MERPVEKLVGGAMALNQFYSGETTLLILMQRQITNICPVP